MNFVGNDAESEPRKSFWIFVRMPKGDSLVYLFASIEQANDGAETAAIDRLVLSWSENMFFILSTGTRIRIDSVMHPRSSSRRRNTSASVTVTVTQWWK